MSETYETVEKLGDEKDPFALFVLSGFFFPLLFAARLDSSTLPLVTELIAALENAPVVLCFVR